MCCTADCGSAGSRQPKKTATVSDDTALNQVAALTWKHSQYFFLQPDFLQWQPRRCAAGAASPPPTGTIFALKASGLRSSIDRRVAATVSLRHRNHSSLSADPQLWHLHVLESATWQVNHFRTCC